MKRTYNIRWLLLLFASLYISMSQSAQAQSGAIALMDTASLGTQMDFIQERTRIYNDYRAIREDVFQKMKNNVADTIQEARQEIGELNSRLSERDNRIETLNSDLSRANTEKDEAIRNRDSLSIFGLQMNKKLYSSILWFIILGLIVLALVMIFLFKRSHQVTREVREHLKIVQEEFEQYRKSSREKYEKLVVSHHNEIMKLKKG